MKKLKFIISSFIIFLLVGCSQQEHPLAVMIEETFQEHHLSYTVKPIPNKYSLDSAEWEKAYEVGGHDIYVYLIKEGDMETADFTVSNELFPDLTVATVKNYIFVYSKEIGDNAEMALYQLIDEIREEDADT